MLEDIRNGNTEPGHPVKNRDGKDKAADTKSPMITRKEDLSPVLINVGFGNVVAAAKIVAVVTPGSAPMKRLREEARERGKLIDATEGRRTRSIIITDSDHIILSALQAETLAQRFSGKSGTSEP